MSQPTQTIRNFIVWFDLETTGRSPSNCQTTEWCARCGKREFSLLVKPSIPIPADVVDINGITDEMVKNASNFGEVFDAFIAWLPVSSNPVRYYLAAHNCYQFDELVIRAEAQRHKRTLPANITFLDTLPAIRAAIPGLPSYSLCKLTYVDSSHRAMGDVNALQKYCMEHKDVLKHLFARVST